MNRLIGDAVESIDDDLSRIIDVVGLPQSDPCG
jgi:hypothetical protein